MANFGLKIDLLKLRSAFLTNIKGRTDTKRCLCIPIDDSDLFLGEKGLYLNLTAIELREPQYKDTHCIKVSLDKERYEALTEDKRKALPILGGMRQIETKQHEMQTTSSAFVDTFDDGFGDCPF